MRKKVSFLLATTMLVSTLAFTGCGKSEKTGSDNATSAPEQTTEQATQAPAENPDATTAPATETAGGKQLTVQVGPNPETIDPALNSAVDGGNMILHAFECLLTVDKDNNIAPGQAESWETSEDKLTYTFHLRDGLKWSDGSPLTANDFVYSWKRVCDPTVAAPYAETVLSMVKGYDEAIKGNLDALAVSAPDDKTFVVELSNFCPYFESLAAFATLSPVNQKAIEADTDGWATKPETYICNGPFKITEWVPSSHIIMTKNENYWNKDAIKLGSIKWLLMEDGNAAYSAYKTGEALMIKTVPTEEIPSLTGTPDFFIDQILGTYYISLNCQKEPFTNPLVRKALSMAVDRDYVANTLMQGTYSPATNFIGPGWADPAGGSFYDKANGGQPYLSATADVEGAKKVLEEAGYPNGEGLPTITYTTNPEGYHKVVAEYLQQAWAEIGVTLDVNIVEWASFTPMRRSGDFEIARNGWVGDYNDTSNMFDVLYSTNGNNDGKYTSAAFDAAMDAARTEKDPAKRSEDLHAAEDALMEEAGCIPLAYYSDFWLQSPKITGAWHSPYGYWFFMYADVTE
ncbi:MAG: peptide ABC transporter substrate-binding protein [Clostridiales bacterium]|nr:peptide ABC transporter substrate-binding protein [Clostridiales bacterium]